MPHILSMPNSSEQQVGLVFLNQVNQLSESNFRALQNLVGDHSVAGVPASFYNLTKSVPDPSEWNYLVTRHLCFDSYQG